MQLHVLTPIRLVPAEHEHVIGSSNGKPTKCKCSEAHNITRGDAGRHSGGALAGSPSLSLSLTTFPDQPVGLAAAKLLASVIFEIAPTLLVRRMYCHLPLSILLPLLFCTC